MTSSDKQNLKLHEEKPAFSSPSKKSESGQEKEDPKEKNEKQKKDKKDKEESKGAKRFRVCRQWTIKLIAMVIALGVVGLCLVSAILSIKKLMDTKDMPASTYQQKLHSGPHKAPGIVFLGEDIMLHQCYFFNFTSLNVDELDKDASCDPQSIQLTDKDSLSSSVYDSLPEFLQEMEEEVTLTLLEGPSDWSNKDTTQAHFSVPNTVSGIWAIVHPDFNVAYDQFVAATTTDAKWSLAADLILENSMNFVSTQFRSFFLMSKQEFKSFGVLDTVRIDMEITLIEQNVTYLDSYLDESRSADSYTHVEAFYQWKDGFFMEGDQFLATNIWTIVTIIASALLMLERGWTTTKRVMSMKIASKKKAEKNAQAQKISADLKAEEEELNEKQRRADLEPKVVDSRPSTAQSDVMLVDPDANIAFDAEDDDTQVHNSPEAQINQQNDIFNKV